MPVVVKELIIKAQVDNAPQTAARSAVQGRLPEPIDKESLLEDCVEAVLEVLDRKDER